MVASTGFRISDHLIVGGNLHVEYFVKVANVIVNSLPSNEMDATNYIKYVLFKVNPSI